MKTSLRIRVAFLLMTIALLTTTVKAAEYYVVIGAFAQESNARRFTGTVRHFFRDVSYSFNESRKLYYVHVMRTPRIEDARNWSLYLRNEKGFKDAWVLAGPDSKDIASDSRGPRFEGSMNQTAHAVSLTVSDGASAVPSENTVSSGGNYKMAAWTLADGLAFIKNVNSSDVSIKSSEAVKVFRLKVEDAKGNAIPSEVMLVNFEKVQKVASFQNGEAVAIRGTKPNQMITFVCDVIGYSPETRMFNLDHLSRGKDISRGEDGTWEVRIKVKKMGINDVSFMNKTIFYKDAAILEESSVRELDELVALMKSNLSYKIILHSHCNPGEKRMLKFPVTEQNYFDLEETIDKAGSDKVLTKKRAEVVRNYLVHHGIDKKRISLVAWGSMDMVVNSTSKDANINERIEMELASQ